jgi:hypothetical protein
LEKGLHPDHLNDLRKSGINDLMIEQSGIHSVRPADIGAIIHANGNLKSLMAIPYPGTDFTRFKLFPACKLSAKDEKPRKYFQPTGSPINLYKPPGFNSEASYIAITEGEKKALRGTQEGMNVCALGGIWNFASKDENDQPQLIEALASIPWADKDAMLIPDGDFQQNPSVCHAVYRLGRMLRKEGARVLVARLPSNSKLDDYLCSHSVEDFTKLEMLTLDDRIFRGAAIKEQGLQIAIRRAILPVDEFVRLKVPPRPYIIKPLLRPGSLGMIYSPAGWGKTNLCLALGIVATYKAPFGNWTAENAVKTLYVDAEMPVDLLQSRLDALRYGLGHPAAHLDVWSSEYAEMEGWPRPVLTNKEWRKDIYDFVVAEKYGLVILDNKSALAPGIDESSKQEWDQVSQWMLSLRFAGIAATLVHHAGKSGQQRGTSGVEDSLDFILKLEHPNDYTEEDGCNVDVSFQKARGIYGQDVAPFNFKIVKTPTGDGLTWVISPKKTGKDGAIIAALGSGVSATEAAEAAGVTRQYVSKIKIKAITEGYLEADEEGKKVRFTEAGKRKYGSADLHWTDLL